MRNSAELKRYLESLKPVLEETFQCPYSPREDRYYFHVVCKDAPFTKLFIDQMKSRSDVNLMVSKDDRGIVEQYEKLYQNEVISMEVTKPSEQTFKALYNCTQRGASVLLFSEPVGRQEDDNLNFLERHFLVPSQTTTKKLWKSAQAQLEFSANDQMILFGEATKWRGISIQDNPEAAANFIDWCLKNKLLLAMSECKLLIKPQDPHKDELLPDGAAQFWTHVKKDHLIL